MTSGRKAGLLLIVSSMIALALLLGVRSSKETFHRNDGESLTDQAGRTVNLPENVKSVVCLWPETTRILYAIGAKDLLVGVDDRVAADPVLKKVWPGIKDVPVVGTMSSANAEHLVATRPDLVIVSARSKRLAEQIASYNLSVVCFHPEGRWENFLDEISLVGRCVNREHEAANLRRFLEEKMAEVETIVAPIPQGHRPRVYVTFAYDPLRTTPLDSVELAGGINLAAGNREIWYTVDMEWLLGRDPDVIVQHALGKFNLTTMGGGWSSLRAVKEGKVYRVYLGFCGVDPAQYLVHIRQMAALFHQPETPWARNLAADGRAIFQRIYARGDVFDAIAREMNVTLARPVSVGLQAKGK